MIGDDSAARRALLRARPAERACTTTTSGFAPSSSTPTARSARAARRCSSPYTDDPEQPRPAASPRRRTSRTWPTRALRAGFQVNTHAIGDRGNRIVLDAYEAALERRAHGRPPLPHRARADPQPRRHPALRASSASSRRCRPCIRRATCTGRATRLGNARPARRVRVALAAQHRRHHPERQRLPGGSGESAALVPLRRLAAGRDNWPAGGWLPEQRMTREEALEVA